VICREALERLLGEGREKLPLPAGTGAPPALQGGRALQFVLHANIVIALGLGGNQH
jgi:hypothetical protein